MKITNPFTELDFSGWNLDKDSIKRIEEIKEIDRMLEFLDSIKVFEKVDKNN